MFTSALAEPPTLPEKIKAVLKVADSLATNGVGASPTLKSSSFVGFTSGKLQSYSLLVAIVIAVLTSSTNSTLTLFGFIISIPWASVYTRLESTLATHLKPQPFGVWSSQELPRRASRPKAPRFSPHAAALPAVSSPGAPRDADGRRAVAAPWRKHDCRRDPLGAIYPAPQSAADAPAA